MKLFKLSQDINNGYDTYDSAVVAAENEDAARHTHPDKNDNEFRTWDEIVDGGSCHIWVGAHQVEVQYIGETDLPAGVICASFNAG